MTKFQIPITPRMQRALEDLRSAAIGLAKAQSDQAALIGSLDGAPPGWPGPEGGGKRKGGERIGACAPRQSAGPREEEEKSREGRR